MPAGTSGVPAAKTLSSLTTAEKAQICDWSASLSGGYGRTWNCGEGATASNASSQAECVADFPPSCSATVAQLEACSLLIAASICNVDRVITSPECAPIFQCSQP